MAKDFWRMVLQESKWVSHDNESEEGKSRCVSYCPDRCAQKNMSSHIKNAKDSAAYHYI